MNVVTLESQLDSTKWVSHTHNVIAEARAIEGAAINMETGMRGYLLAGKEEFLEPYIQGKQVFHEKVESLKQTVSDNPPQVELLGTINETLLNWEQKVTEPMIELRRKIGNAPTMNYMAEQVSKAKGKFYFDKFRGQIAQLSEDEALKPKANAILTAAINMETGMRGFLLAGKEEFLEPYNHGSASLFAGLDELQNITDQAPEQRAVLKEIRNTINDWQTLIVEPMFTLRREIGDAETMDDMAALVGEARGKTYFDAFRLHISKFIGREQVLMEARQEEAISASNLAEKITIYGTIGLIILSFIILMVIVQSIITPVTDIINRLTEGTEQTFGLANQFTSASQSIAEGANEQATALEETSSSMEEITSMVKRNAEVATRTNTEASNARAATEEGVRQMSELRSSADIVSTSAKEMESAMHAIKESSNSISKIIKTIDEIAFQTNILALNAAVEAARAGEAGAGFAVVADEVRSLARRASEAASETSAIIADSMDRSDRGVQMNQVVGEKLNVVLERAQAVDNELKTIASAVTNVNDSMNEVESSVKQQVSGISEINSAVSQVSDVTQANAASAEEAASAAEQMNTQSAELLEVVETLIQIVHGSRHKKGAAHAHGSSSSNSTQLAKISSHDNSFSMP